MIELAFIGLLVFIAPFIILVILFGKVNRLERQLQNTIESFQRKFNQLQGEMREGSDVTERPATPEPVTPPAPPVETPEAPSPAATPATRIEPEPEPAPEPTAEPESEPLPEPVLEVEPQPAPEPAMAYAAEEPGAYEAAEPNPRFQFDFEDIFGRRLPIWAGGIALAVAGIFLVRYSIEAGLVTPTVRVFASFVFGLSLLGGAEAAFRFEHKIADPRVRQALAGAGIATLYGAFYLAGTAYGLIGAGTAFIGLAAVTAGAIALSFRFGLPCAILGLVGGFAAPMLVESDAPNVPMLALYLALVTGGLAWTGAKQSRPWLGYAALAAGLGWGVLMLFAGIDSSSDFAALGGYLIALGTVLPAFLHSRDGPSIPQLAAAGIATLQMAVLVDNAGFAPLTWGLYLLIGAALAILGWKIRDLRLGSAVAALIGLWLLLIWPDPAASLFAGVVAGMAAIFAAAPLVHQLRGQAELVDRLQVAAVALGLGVVSYVQFGSWGELAREPILAASTAGLALLPATAFWSRWRSDNPLTVRSELPLLGASGLLAFGALLMMTPAWLAPVMAAAVALALLSLLWRRDCTTLLIASWAAIVMTLLSLLATPAMEPEAALLFGASEGETNVLRAVLRWLAMLAPLLAMALIRPAGIARKVGEGFAAIAAYGLVAQIMPADWLAWTTAAAAMALFHWERERTAASGMWLSIAGLWSLMPVVTWLAAGLESTSGIPFLVESAVEPQGIALMLAPFAVASSVIAWRGEELPVRLRGGLGLTASVVAIIAFHSLYKQAWGIDTLFQFEWLGMGERTIWQGLLLAAAFAVSQYAPERAGNTPFAKPLSLGLLAASLSHFALFTLFLHNPLWDAQHVGPTPVANWLSLAYAIAIGGIILARSNINLLQSRLAVFVDGAIMVLVAVLAFSLLRQVFAGSLIVSTTIGANESLLISLLGIVLALGFLWWGSARDTRSWRIGSLVLMLLAVLKVFLIDAAALEGLLRIASFMALGFSLIGIGWVYSRQLKSRNAPEAPSSIQ